MRTLLPYPLHHKLIFSWNTSCVTYDSTPTRERCHVASSGGSRLVLPLAATRLLCDPEHIIFATSAECPP